MLLLALRNWRARPGRTLVTTSAIALGVALVFATRLVGVAAEQQATAARASRLAGADLEVLPAHARFFPAAVADQILRNPAVAQAAPLYRYSLAEYGLDLLGLDPDRLLTPYELIAGEDLATAGRSTDHRRLWLPHTWAVQRGLGVGQSVRLEIGGSPLEFTIAGLVKATPLGAPTALLPLAALQSALNAPGAATSILVRLQPGHRPDAARAALAEALGPALVVASAQQSGQAGNALASLTNIAFPFASVVVLLAGAYLVYNAFALTLTERRREIGQLRALGMTRGQVLRLTLAEAALTAGAGTLAGLPLGLAASLAATGVGASASVMLDGAALAAGLALLITLGVTFSLARSAGRVSPLSAMRSGPDPADGGPPRLSLYERWGWVGALGSAAAFLILNAWVARALLQGELDGLRFFTYPLFPLFLPPLVALLAIPTVMRGAFWLVERLLPRSVVVRLAVGTLRRQRSRALLTAATFAISLMFVIAFAGISLGLATSTASQAAPILAADFMVGLPPPSGAAWPPPPQAPPAGLLADLDALRSGAQVSEFNSISVPGYDIGFDPSVLVTDFDYVRAHPQVVRPIEGTLDQAEAYSRVGPTILLAEVAARRHALHPGDAAVIGTVEGPVTFTVGLVTAGLSILPAPYGQRYFDSQPAMYLVTARPGRDREALRDQLQVLQRRYGLQIVENPEQFLTTATNGLLTPIFALFSALSAIAGVVAGLNLINVLVASVLERQRELGTLRALGLTQAQVRGLVIVEAGLLGLVGSGLGALGALVITWASVRLSTQGMQSILGPMEQAPRLPWELAGAALVIGPGMAMLAALWPADRAASVHPADAMRAEGAAGFLPPAKQLGPTGLRGLLARMPLAARLSLTTGLIIALAIAALTAVRVNYERQLLEENMRAIFARTLELMVNSTASQLPADLTELTPAVVAGLARQSGAQVDTLSGLFQGGASPYDFSLKYVLITDTQYRVLTSNRAEYNNTVLTDTVPLAGAASNVRLTHWTGERAFEAMLAITNQAGQPLGYTIVGVSTAPVDNITRDIVRGSLALMTVALVSAIGLTIIFTRRALRPLAEVVAAAGAVARGDLTQRVSATRWDDAGRLARAFNDMVAGLAEHERVEEELRLARVIQQTLLPQDLPRLPGWRLEAIYRPARAVGGDFYDVIPLAGGGLALVIGDVTDKGMPAALVMATTRAVLRAAAGRVPSPGAVLAEANGLLHPDLPPRMFATCFFAVLDPVAGRLVFANAGHDLPFLRRRAGEVVALRARGMPLGALPGMGYDEQAVLLEPGDGILFYTDGIAEAHDAARGLYGFPRLQALLGRVSFGPGLIPAVLADLARFTGSDKEQEDDVTLMTLERRQEPLT